MSAQELIPEYPADKCYLIRAYSAAEIGIYLYFFIQKRRQFFIVIEYIAW